MTGIRVLMKTLSIILVLLILFSVGGFAHVFAAPATPVPANVRASYLAPAGSSPARVLVSWDWTHEPVDSFEIFRSTDGVAFAREATLTSGAREYEDERVAPGSTYWYQVIASVNGVRSAPAASGSVFIASPPQGSPTNLAATVASNNTRVDLSWRYAHGASVDGYEVERSTGNSNSFTRIARVDGGNNTSLSDTGLSPGTTYVYRVRAYSAAGVSAYSPERSVTTGGGERVPTAPSNPAAAVSGSQVTLTWRDNSNNEAGFRIDRRVGAGQWQISYAAVEANVTSFIDHSLPAETYRYRVRAWNSAGESANTSAVTATVQTVALPTAPSALALEIRSASQVRITWKDNSNNETGFRVERRVNNGSFAEIATVDRNIATYTDTNLSQGNHYSYRVRAYNAAGNSDYSNTAGLTLAPPPAPSNLRASWDGSTRVALVWQDNSDNEAGFRIERSRDGGSFSRVASVDANVVSYTDTGLSSSSSYTYRVRAYNAIGESAFSNEAKAAATVVRETEVKLYIGWLDYYVNDQRLTMDAAPVIMDGRTMLPIRFVAEAIGAKVDWNGEQRKTKITLNDKVIELIIGSNMAMVNDKMVMIDKDNPNVQPVIVPPGRNLMPLRFVGENLGCQVDWNPQTQEIRIRHTAR